MPGPISARLERKNAIWRVAFSCLLGLVVGSAVALRASPLVAMMAGWDAGGVTLLTLGWISIWSADAKATQARAGSDDPGRTAVYVLVLLTSATSLFAAVALARFARTLEPHIARQIVLLSLSTVAVSWALTHTALTLRYAHLYYRDDGEGIGGLEFPGGAAPTFFDFAYFAFTVGMAFQTSDVCISSPQIRRTVLFHAALSFAYNTAIVAFALNLAFGVAW